MRRNTGKYHQSFCLPRSGSKKNAGSAFLNCLCHYREKVYGKIANFTLFDIPPTFDFIAEDEICLKDSLRLNILKTDTRTKKTMRIGNFRAREIIKVCPKCGYNIVQKNFPASFRRPAISVMIYLFMWAKHFL